MFKLLRYFSLTSAVAILLVTVVLVILYRQTAVNELVELAENQNVVLARSFANTIWPRFSAYVTSVSGLDGDALRARPETLQIHETLKGLAAGLPVLKVKIYNLDGLTVFSSQASQIGEDKSNSPGFIAAAREGRPASKQAHRDRFSTFSGEVADLHLVESYLPIRRGDGRIEGVFELYSDVTPLMGKIARSTDGLAAGILLVFGLLYGVLFLIVRRADRILKRQYVDVLRGEQALRESEERFRAVVDNSPTKIHIKDLDGRYTLVNRQSEILFGVTNEEARGKTSRDIFPKEVADSFTGHDQAVIESGRTIENEEEWVCDDGVHTFLTVKFPILGATGAIAAVGAIGTDITERKRAEEALRESEERFRDVAEAASDWFWEMDENLRFTFFSGRRQQLTGLSPKEYIGRTRWQVAGANPDDDEKWRDHRAMLEAHEPFRDFEYAFTRKNGKTKYNKVSGTPVFDANGVFKGYRGAATDVTEQKDAQAQLIQASKLATLGEMASGIAHELNQPLSVVGMAAENSLISMEEGTFDTEFVRKKLQTIVGQRDRMAGIVNHMRLFSRRDTTAMELFDPVESVRGAVGLIAKQFQALGIELEETLPAACRNVFGHPVQLEQVVLNLLNNARDAVRGAME
ncbi:MAG: PAS domain S-box protein, partial [Proteobacteria bacterium]|nr:PAS domain S-box protein [Pseudomonadota bacterium]